MLCSLYGAMYVVVPCMLCDLCGAISVVQCMWRNLCCERLKSAPQARLFPRQSAWCNPAAAAGGDEADTRRRRPAQSRQTEDAA
eukprot:5269785-Pyramimonas_sp.AAC.1